MLPPEIQRILLLIGLAATGYLLILAWFDDQEAAKTPVAYSEAPIAAQSGQGDQPQTPGLVAPVGTPTTTDVPDASSVPGVAPQSTADPDAQAQNAAGDLIRVQTPTLNVWIDPVGGDIVRVQLPKYPVDLEQPDVPYLLLDRSVEQTYVAQSGLIWPQRQGKGRSVFSTAAKQYHIGAGETVEVALTARTQGAVVSKIFSFDGDDYLIKMRYEVQNQTKQTLHAAMFAQIKRDDKPPRTDESFSLAPQPYLGAAFTTAEERYLKYDFEDVDEQPFDATEQGGWVAFLQHYFLSAWVADAELTQRYSARRAADGNYIFGFTGPLKEIAPGSSTQWHAQFYAGPKDQKRLEEIAPNLNLTIDYGFLWWLAVPLFSLLDWLHDLVGNWGVAIILLTVIVKILLLPLSAAGYKSMANMRRVAPAMKRLQERYANDREKLSREMMALYKKEGANPLGGCLPMLLPMPIFLALYWVLFESVELRQAPFFLWIEDLSKMDPFFVLPLLMGASTYWMQSLNPQVGDPMQQRMMKMMPIMFTVLFLFFPAGLVLYWLVNNLLSIAQQQYVYKQVDAAQAKAQTS